jgi:hypothetical protein
MIPAMHAMIPERMSAPGAFMANTGGMFVALFVIEHLLYGAIVGALYGPLRQPRARHNHREADGERCKSVLREDGDGVQAR